MTRPPDIITLLHEDAWARRLARALTRDPHRADDLVQEAYVREASRAARELEAGRESRAPRQPRAWFARVLSNLAREAHRRDRARIERERARAGVENDAGAPQTSDARHNETSFARLHTHATPAELAARAEVQARLANEVLALDGPLREVVLLHHFEGLGPTEIAASLGVPRSTVQDRLTRAHTTLRVRLADLEREPRTARGLALLVVPAALPARTALTPPFLAYMSSKHALVAGALLLSIVVAVVRAASRSESTTSSSSTQEGTALRGPLPAASERAPEALATVPATERSEATVATAPLENALATVHARVLDEVGAPVGGALVQLVQTEEERRASTVELEPGVIVVMGPRGTTDAEGRTSLQVPTGRPLELTAQRPRRGSSLGRATLTSLEPDAAAELELRVHVTPDLDLALRVVAEEDGALVAGLEVHVDGQALGRNPVVLPPGIAHAAQVITDGTGSAALRVASWRDEGALLLGKGRAPRIVLLREAGPRHGQEEPVTIAVSRAARIEGVVQGAPRGARVRVRFTASRIVPNPGSSDRVPEGFGTRSFVIEAPLDPSGQFTLAGLPPRVALTPEVLAADGATTLYVAPTALTLAPGETHASSWQIPAVASVVCACRDGRGEPIVGVDVWLWSDRGEAVPTVSAGPSIHGPERVATTDTTGHAHFESVGAGRWCVALAPHGEPRDEPAGSRGGTQRHFASHAESFEVLAHGGERSVALLGEEGLYLRGRVLGPDGAPRMATLAAGTGGYRVSGMSWAKDGTFALGPVPAGEYMLHTFGAGTAEDLDLVVEPLLLRPTHEPCTVRMTPGGKLSIDVLQRDDGVAGTARWLRDDAWFAGSTSLREGSLETPALLEGSYQVLVVLADGRAAARYAVNVVSGAVTDVVLDPVEAGVLQVTYVGQSNTIALSVVGAGGAIAGDTPRAGGTYRVELPPGEYHVRVGDLAPARGSIRSAPRLLAEHAVTITAGATTALEVDG